MIRLRWLIAAALLYLPLPAGAQSPEWKAIACNVENPESQRGTGITIYFVEGGQVRFGGSQYPATITRAEIQFCFSTVNEFLDMKTCYTISRISGRFSASNIGKTTGVVTFNGDCIQEEQQPKF